MVSDLDVFADMQFGSYNRAMWPLHIKPAVSLPSFLIKFISWLHHSYFLCCFLFLQTQTFYSLPHTLPTSLIPLSYAFPLTWIPWGKSPPPDCEHPLACRVQFPVAYSFVHSFIHSLKSLVWALINSKFLKTHVYFSQLLRDKLHVPFPLSQVYSCLLFSFVVFISSGIFVTPYMTPMGCQPRRY